MEAVLIEGFLLGIQLGILGVGLTLVYGLGGVLNLAHGQFAVLAAVVVSLLSESGLAIGLAALIGIAALALLGAAVDLSLMKPVYRLQGEPRILLGLLLMLGVAFVIEGFLTWRYPIEALRIQIGSQPLDLFGQKIRTGLVLAATIAVVVGLLLALFFRRSTYGRAVRSVIEDEVGAQLCGINPSSTRTFVFAISAGLAGMVGVTRSMSSPVDVSAGTELTIFALIVAVVGGLGSVSGAFVAGVLLGIVKELSSFYIGSYITTIILLAVAALTIVLRPSGLLGTVGGHR
jgi:branched-chain amino acid transport system permease protein